MAEMKACPFCGSDAIEKCITKTGSYYACEHCDASSGEDINWNTRPLESALQSELDKAQQNVQSLSGYVSEFMDGWEGKSRIRQLEKELASLKQRISEAVGEIKKLASDDLTVDNSAHEWNDYDGCIDVLVKHSLIEEEK